MNLPIVSLLIPLTLLYVWLPAIASNSCSAGDFSSSSDPSTCKPCSAGYYCPYLNPNMPSYGTTRIGCSEYTYEPSTGGASIDDCLKCDVGTTSSIVATYCRKCPHGTYCDTKGGAPKNCPPGTYQPNEGATSIQACLTCPPGTLHPLTGGYECYPCPDGYTCNDPAQTPVPISTTLSSSGTSSTKVSSTLTSSTTRSSSGTSSTKVSSTLTSSTTTKPNTPSTIITTIVTSSRATPTMTMSTTGAPVSTTRTVLNSTATTAAKSAGTLSTVTKHILIVMLLLNMVFSAAY